MQVIDNYFIRSKQTRIGIYRCRFLIKIPRTDISIAAHLLSFLVAAKHQCHLRMHFQSRKRLILPQQQVIRDLLDIGAMPFVCRESELSETFAKLKEDPALVITDSQVFPLVYRRGVWLRSDNSVCCGWKKCFCQIWNY